MTNQDTQRDRQTVRWENRDMNRLTSGTSTETKIKTEREREYETFSCRRRTHSIDGHTSPSTKCTERISPTGSLRQHSVQEGHLVLVIQCISDREDLASQRGRVRLLHSSTEITVTKERSDSRVKHLDDGQASTESLDVLYSLHNKHKSEDTHIQTNKTHRTRRAGKRIRSSGVGRSMNTSEDRALIPQRAPNT